MAFDYADTPDPIRPDIPAAHRAFWERLARPGTWLTGAERVAIAEECRRARSCRLCADRKAALSASMVPGAHEASGPLSAELVEAVHRITTDASRLSRSWVDGLLTNGLPVEAYVEAVGVTVQLISVDGFHQALGLPLEALPAPAAANRRGAAPARPWMTSASSRWSPTRPPSIPRTPTSTRCREGAPPTW